MPHISDGQLIQTFKRTALWAWVAAVVLGLGSICARLLGQEAVGSWLLAFVRVAGAVFALAWACLAVSAIVLLVQGGRRKNDA